MPHGIKAAQGVMMNGTFRAPDKYARNPELLSFARAIIACLDDVYDDPDLAAWGSLIGAATVDIRFRASELIRAYS